MFAKSERTNEPPPQRISQEQVEVHWDDILENLRQVSPTDSQWESLESFVDALRKLAKEKRHQATSYARFQELEQEVLHELSDLLRRLDQSSTTWLLELIKSRPIDALDSLTDLCNALHQYKQDRSLSFDSIQEEQRHRQQLTKQELELCRRLSELEKQRPAFQPADTASPHPVSTAPVTAEPSTPEPSTPEPSTQEPSTQEPSTQEPSTQEPSTQEPSTQEPSTQEPSTQEPSTQEPSTQEPSTQEPSTQEPSTQEPVTPEPVTSDGVESSAAPQSEPEASGPAHQESFPDPLGSDAPQPPREQKPQLKTEPNRELPAAPTLRRASQNQGTIAHLSAKQKRKKEKKLRKLKKRHRDGSKSIDPLPAPAPSRLRLSDLKFVEEVLETPLKASIPAPQPDDAISKPEKQANDAVGSTTETPMSGRDPSAATAEPPEAAEPEELPTAKETVTSSSECSDAVHAAAPLPSDKPPLEDCPSDPTFLGEAISNRDFAGAYWWCRSSEAKGETPPVSSQACALAQGVLWNPRSDFAVANDLRQAAASFHATNTLPSELIVSAAALRVALAAPAVEMNHLLACKSALPNYQALLQKIQAFAERGLKIDPSVIGKQLSSEKLNQAIKDARQAAERWIDEGVNRRFSFKPAERVWREFLRNEDFLKGLFEIIARNDISKCDLLRDKLQAWRQRPNILTKIKEADEKTNRKFATDIDAGALEKLVSGCFDAAEMCEAWCDAVAAKLETESPQDWIGKQVAELRLALKKFLPGSKTELEELQTTLDSLQAGAATFALESCELIRSVIAPDEPPLTTISTADNSNYLLGLQPRGLWPAMRRRLWCLPKIRFVDDGGPYEEDIPKLAQALSQAAENKSSVESIFRQRVEDQDFRHTDEMLVLLQESPLYAELQEFLYQSFASASQSLLDKIESVEAMVQDAVLNGSLDETDRLDIENELKWLRESKPRNFRVHWEKLIALSTKLNDLRQQHLQDLQLTWATDRERLLSLLDDTQKNTVTQRVQAAFDSNEPRVAQEILSQLQVAASRHELPELTPANVGSDVLSKFYESQSTILETAQDWTPDQFDNQDPSVSEALQAWKHLRRLDVRTDDKSLLSILNFLGLSSNANSNVLRVTSSKKHQWVHVTAQVEDSGAAPVPQYGSLREGKYEVLLVGFRKSGSPVNTIASAIKSAALQRTPAIVLFQGVLLPEQRMNVARKLRATSMPAIVLDESLLLWLAQITEQRWATFLRVALAFSFSSPYAPTGSVPQEMFFGRGRMLDSILDFEGSGSSVVFGGRQLGKTALLHRARREFHAPARGQIAIYESIQHLGDPIKDVPATEIGRVLRERLNETLFTDSPIKTRELESVASHVRRHMEANPQLRLLILLDEADDFLAQDANQNFKFVIELKKLMEQSNRHVKVVFAGLNSVQRYQRYPNQPFAHLGNPIEVGPLEPAPAYQLIAQPMRDIGYEFEDDAAILKVLSYTNHHPGLIQFFCDELVKGFKNSAIPNWPPLVITNKAIRDLYARSGTKQEIAKRFSWTIDLNPLFSAIICKVSLDQFELPGTASVKHRVDEMLASLKLYWPAAFAPMAEEDLRTLLNDMCGLGIFFRSEDGYQLRNPNLSDAIGSYEEVFARLEAMKDSPAPRASIDADYHRQLILKTNRRSPFTLAQMSQLLKQSFGVGIIFGSDALGFIDIEPSLREAFGRATDREVRIEVQALTIASGTASGWKTQLEQLRDQAGKTPRIVLVVDVEDTLEIPAVIQQSLDFCQRRRKAEQSWVRILLRLPPLAVKAWHSLPSETRLTLESAVDCVVAMSLWHPSIVQTHFKKGDRLGGQDVFDTIVACTGGWPLLLNEVFQRCGEGQDPSQHAESVSLELNSHSELQRTFAEKCGATEQVIPSAVREVLIEYAKSPCEADFLELAIEEHIDQDESASALLRTLVQLQLAQRTEKGIMVSPQVMQVLESRNV